MLHPEPAVERGLARSRIMRVVHADAYPRADVPHAAAVDHALHRIDAAVEHHFQILRPPAVHVAIAFRCVAEEGLVVILVGVEPLAIHVPDLALIVRVFGTTADEHDLDLRIAQLIHDAVEPRGLHITRRIEKKAMAGVFVIENPLNR